MSYTRRSRCALTISGYLAAKFRRVSAEARAVNDEIATLSRL